MGADIKADLQIPDLWFDFYARLVPGAAFVAALMYFVFGLNVFRDRGLGFADIAVILALGYCSSLLTQPVASRITGWIQLLGERAAGIEDPMYIRNVQVKLDRSSRDAMIISKMHGEVTMYVQLALLSSVLLLVVITAEQPRISTGCCPLIATLVFFVFAIEVSNRRAKRAIAADPVRATEQGADSDTNGKT